MLCLSYRLQAESNLSERQNPGYNRYYERREHLVLIKRLLQKKYNTLGACRDPHLLHLCQAAQRFDASFDHGIAGGMGDAETRIVITENTSGDHHHVVLDGFLDEFFPVPPR